MVLAQRVAVASLAALCMLVALQAQSVYIPALVQQTAPVSALYAPISSTGTTLIKSGLVTFYGVQSFGTQLGVTKCFDSVDASGQQVAGGVTLTLGAIIQPPTSMGIALTNGLSCTQTISVVGGLLVLYR